MDKRKFNYYLERYHELLYEIRFEDDSLFALADLYFLYSLANALHDHDFNLCYSIISGYHSYLQVDDFKSKLDNYLDELLLPPFYTMEVKDEKGKEK